VVLTADNEAKPQKLVSLVMPPAASESLPSGPGVQRPVAQGS